MLSPEEIAGIAAAVVAVVTAIGAAVVKIINEVNRGKCDNPRCCLTKKPLKSKKKKTK